jgi:hypothetical protein
MTSAQLAAATPVGPPDGKKALPADTLGLALSGGGVRSAAFCLGVLQALTRGGWLPHVDFLSTVSGGGYIGAFLGRFFDLCGKSGGLTGALPNQTAGAAQDRVARDLRDARSAPVSWLRRHSNYLSPSGLGEAATNIAGFWRNLLSIYLVLGLFFFALFGVLNAVHYGNFPHGFVMSLVSDCVTVLTPLNCHVMITLSGPWLVLAELALWLTVVPLMLAYWLVSEDLPETFVAPVLTAAALLAVGLLLASGNPLSLIVLAAAVVWALQTWAAVLRAEGHADPYNPARLLLARSRLTGRLAFWGAAATALAGLALVDGLGRWLARLMLEGGLTTTNVSRWFLGAGMIILSIAGMLRMAARSLVSRRSGPSEVLMFSRPYLWAVLMLIVGSLPPLIVLSFASHAAYELGDAYWQGLWFTAGALVLSLLLGSRACVQFINRSSPLGIYAARLATAFLGAVNPQRRTHPEGGNVTHVVPGDDVPLSQYAPQAAGGPLHLINCAVNETVDVASQRGLRDRQAENLAIGPAGVNIAQQWHALWAEENAASGALVPLAPGGGPHPFLASGHGQVAVEPLNLREWTAISGAALGPGMGRQTGLGRALLLTLANLRLGYWWNSGLSVNEREHVPVRGGLWRVLTDFLSQWFRAQSLLLSELIGRFGGPWYRYWYLSDGGNFEVTGAYELLRRRVPFVIACDAGRDEVGSDLALLVRLARVDFGAEVEAVTADPAVLQRLAVPQEVAGHLGSLTDVMPGGGLARAHAALFLVRYPALPDGPADDLWLQRRHTWLLYLKATLTGDEPADIRNYAALHPSFPHEPTFNQFFDEPQWESYRKLGEHIGGNLFGIYRSPDRQPRET